MGLHYVCITIPDALGTFRPPRGHALRITSLHLENYFPHTGQTVLRLPGGLLLRQGGAADGYSNGHCALRDFHGCYRNRWLSQPELVNCMRTKREPGLPSRKASRVI